MYEPKKKSTSLRMVICFVLATTVIGIGQTLSRQQFRVQVLENIDDGNSQQVQQLILGNRNETIRFIETLIDSSIIKKIISRSDAGKQDWKIAKTLASEYSKAFHDNYYLERANRNRIFTPDGLRKKAEIIKLKDKGKNAYYKGNYQKAFSIYSDALQLAKDIKDIDEEGTLIGNLGATNFYLGNFDTALVFYQESLRLLEEIGDKRRVGNRLGNIANVYSDKSDYPNAIVYFEKALNIRQEIGDKRGMAADMNNLGLVNHEMGSYKLALSNYQKAYEINKSINNIRSTGKNLANIANVHINLGDYPEALTLYQEAIKIRRQRGDRKGEGIDTGNMGIIHQSLGDFTLALRHYQEALAIQRETGYKEGEAYQLGRIAELYTIKGEYARAIQTYNEALKIHHDLGHVHGEVTWLEALGGIYSAVGDHKRALESLDNVLALNKSIGNYSGEATTFTKIGRVYQKIKDYEQARDSFEQALKIHKELGEKWGECLNYAYLASLVDQEGDTSIALSYLKKAEKIADKIDEKILQVLIQQKLGDFYRNNGDTRKSHKAYEKGLLISEGMEHPELKWQLYYGQGKLWESQRDNDHAYYAYRAAITSIEDIREKAKIQELREGIFHDRFDAYRSIIKLLVQMGRVEEAFQFIERSRSKNMLDLLGNNKIPTKNIKSREQIGKEQALRAKIGTLLTRIFQEKRYNTDNVRDAAIEDYNTELKKARKEYKHLLIDLKIQNLDYASLVSVEPSSTSNIQKMLDKESAILEYLLNDDSIIIFAITRESIEAITIPEGEEIIKGKIMLFQGTAVQNISPKKLDQQHWLPPLEDLYNLLVKPVLNNEHLAGKKHLIIIPHGLLHYLPFQALVTGNNGENKQPHFLIMDYLISYAPSASVLQFCKKKSSIQKDNLLLLAPRTNELPMSEYEVTEIAGNFGKGAEYHLKEKATESLVKQQGHDFRQLHFATTAIFNKSNPLFSRLELAASEEDDGNLEVHEIFGLELNANLVTISACQTALGSGHTVPLPQGDDLVSLTRSFIHAGSPSVVASLWEITDQSAARFMTRFYSNLKSMNKAEALTQTQRDMISGNIQSINGENYSHPYHWAPFVLVGDWE